jgi:hypothetical protein
VVVVVAEPHPAEQVAEVPAEVLTMQTQVLYLFLALVALPILEEVAVEAEAVT